MVLFAAASSIGAQTLDGFAPNVGSPVNTIAIQTDGKIIVGGGFIISQNATRLARINADGSIDTSFVPFTGFSSLGGVVNDIVIQADGKLIVVGNFTVVIGGETRNLIARLNPNGSVDTTFIDPGLSAGGLALFSIEFQSDGKIITGGNSSASNDGRAVRRFTADGAIDPAFSSPTIVSDNLNFKTSLIVQPDDKIVFGGSFPTVNGQSRRGIVRLNADGTFDSTFNPNLSITVSALGLQADGKYLIGNGNAVQDAPRVFRFNPDGSIDTSFTSVRNNGSASIILPKANGKILFGVSNGGNSSLFQLNADGTPDPAFRSLLINNSVIGIARQADGKIIIGGAFSTVDGQSRTRLARIIVPSDPSASVSVSGLVTTPDGRGLRNATVIITSAAGVRRTVLTSSFGAYTFNDVASNETYTLSVNSRRYRFAARQVAVNGNLSDVNFVGLE
ncbi:MAG: carboxypeptidase regulatory-like domain-containing protein [Pyrinomonadaceae bacterium]